MEKYGIARVPTILVLRQNKKGSYDEEIYDGNHNINQLILFLESFVEKEKTETDIPILELTSESFHREIQKIEGPVMVHLYKDESFPLFNETLEKFK